MQKFLTNTIFKTIEELEKKLMKFYFHIQVKKLNLGITSKKKSKTLL
jgi:hypothetical protein